MTKEEFLELGAAYATGSLSGEEFRLFEQRMLSASTEELEELGELIGTASLLPLTLERKSPPPRVKEELMAKIRVSARAEGSAKGRTEQLASSAHARQWNWMPFGVTAALLLVALFSVYVVRLLGTIDEQNQQLVSVQQQKEQLATQLVALKDELTREKELLNVLASKRIEIIVMDGKISPVTYGKIIWDPEKKTAILQVSNLPPVPTDKDYQLWIIKGKTPISAGVFAVNDTDANYFKIDQLAVTDPKEIGAFAITLEPKGGVPQPTGEMYMVGSPKLFP